MENKYKPKLTIGVPVHNGERYISGCLECLAKQTYSNFQVIVFENKSTDKTLELVQEFCLKDSRFSVVPSPSFLPAIDNFIRTFQHVSKEKGFFALRAHDDYSSDNYMENLCNVLIQHPEMDIAVSKVEYVTYDGNEKKEAPLDISILEESYWVTFKRPFNKLWFPAPWIYGVYRSGSEYKIFDTLEYYNNVWAGDRLIILSYLLDQKLIYTDTAKFHCRIGTDSYNVYAEKSVSSKIAARFKYFNFMWFYRHRLKIEGPYSFLAFFFLCYKTSAVHTKYSIKRIIKSYFRK